MPAPLKPLPTFSALAIIVTSLHITDDIARNISPPGADNIGAVVIFAVWLLGLLAHERRIGQLILLLGAVFAAAMPLLHMRGARYPAIATGEGGFFFVWTLIACGTTGVIAALLALQALRAPSGPAQQ